jgi:hypothetical protein
MDHHQFVEGYKTGRITISLDAPNAYIYASSMRLGWQWVFTGFLNLFLGEIGLSIAAIVLTIIFKNGWILLAIPCAFLGIGAASPSHNKRTIFPAAILIIAAFVVLALGVITSSWVSTPFLIACIYFLGFFKSIAYHLICRRSFLGLLLTRKEVFDDAISKNLIALESIKE